MLDFSILYLITGIALGYLVARLDHRHAASGSPDTHQIARRVWPHLAAWRDRELTDALAHPDQAREYLIHRLWRRRLGLNEVEPIPAEAQAAIDHAIHCPWPIEED